LAVQTIRAFIPFAAGSATDIVPRALFEPLGAELGQSIIVENRGGEGVTAGANREGVNRSTSIWLRKTYTGMNDPRQI
jgi:tripartite-type tricarboxylate transporter receptor subunit TctC